MMMYFITDYKEAWNRNNYKNKRKRLKNRRRQNKSIKI